MKEIKIERLYNKDNYCIGNLYIDDVYLCNTLEDRVRENVNKDTCKGKIYGRTAIPEGTYNLVNTHSPKYNKNMPRILNVPCFEGILIHTGNTHEDTDGCILVGNNKAVGKVLDSRIVFNKVHKMIEDTHNPITIKIINKFK